MKAKTLFTFLFLLVSGIACAEESSVQIFKAEKDQPLDEKSIYFFAHSLCRSCREPFSYLQTKHKDLNIPITDMQYQENLALYKKCVQKFNIKNSELTLPLICMGNHYIMGWDNTSANKFEEYLKELHQ